MGTETLMTYIANDPIYETEKPYSVGFAVDDIPGAQTTNHVFERRRVTVLNARNHRQHDLNKSGFTFMKWPTSMHPGDFERSELISSQYFHEVKEHLLKAFPQYEDIIFIDHTYRKRDPAFPDEENKVTKYAQPLTLPHLDFSTESAQQRLEQVVDADTLNKLAGRRVDQINVWRVIEGPNNDWPLAVCDFQSVNLKSDPLASDFIFLDTPTENYVLRYNENHRWFYMKDQEVEDVLVFRNATSGDGMKPCAWHAAFDAHRFSTENQKQNQFRHSIDVRVFAVVKGSASSSEDDE